MRPSVLQGPAAGRIGRWARVALLALASGPVMSVEPGSRAAPAVWRCGPGGDYRQQPCPGDGRPLPLAPGPTAAERTEAQARAQQQARQVEALARERRQAEAAARGARAPAGIPITPTGRGAEPPVAPGSRAAGARRAPGRQGDGRVTGRPVPFTAQGPAAPPAEPRRSVRKETGEP